MSIRYKSDGLDDLGMSFLIRKMLGKLVATTLVSQINRFTLDAFLSSHPPRSHTNSPFPNQVISLYLRLPPRIPESRALRHFNAGTAVSETAWFSATERVPPSTLNTRLDFAPPDENFVIVVGLAIRYGEMTRNGVVAVQKKDPGVGKILRVG